MKNIQILNGNVQVFLRNSPISARGRSVGDVKWPQSSSFLHFYSNQRNPGKISFISWYLRKLPWIIYNLEPYPTLYKALLRCSVVIDLSSWCEWPGIMTSSYFRLRIAYSKLYFDLESCAMMIKLMSLSLSKLYRGGEMSSAAEKAEKDGPERRVRGNNLMIHEIDRQC